MKALHVAASGMAAQQTRIDTVANNLANVNTTGFKKSRAVFQDVYYQELRGVAQGARTDQGGGTVLSGLVKDHAVGAFEATNNPLDIALAGPGMLALETPEGETVYTRDGALRVDADGLLRSASGLPVAGGIQIPDDVSEILIDVDGTVSVIMEGDETPFAVGQLEVARFANPAGLRALGSNQFAATVESGRAIFDAQDTEIRQGQIESSNVDVADELIHLVMAQRAYELNSKVVQAADEALQIAASVKR